MLIGLGIDIININRIEELINRWGEKFLKRIFTDREIDYCLKQSYPARHFAVRFSAKEAVFKVFGTGWRKLKWREIEIINDSLGKPEVILKAKAKNISEDMYIRKIHISLSHEKKYAIAQAVAEGGKMNDFT